jgi:hypothetical protein
MHVRPLYRTLSKRQVVPGWTLAARKFSRADCGETRLIAVSPWVRRVIEIMESQDDLAIPPGPSPVTARQPLSPRRRKRGPHVTLVARTSPGPEGSGHVTDRALWEGVAVEARCADGALDPDEWFPVSSRKEVARREAARAIAVCMACPVRAECLELSLRHWDIGQHGVWGGLVAADRARLRRRVLAGRGITVVRDDDRAVMSQV